MPDLSKYRWQATHVATLIGALTILTLITHLTPSPVDPGHFSEHRAPIPNVLAPPSPIASPPTVTRPPPPKPPSNPREVVVGPTGISSRYTLLNVDRTQLSPTLDKLTLRLQITSLAAENLVSPVESDMFELQSQGQGPIRTHTAFRLSLPGSESRDQEIVFNVPSILDVKNTTLQIRYYNYQKEIPLSALQSTVTNNR